MIGVKFAHVILNLEGNAVEIRKNCLTAMLALVWALLLPSALRAENALAATTRYLRPLPAIHSDSVAQVQSAVSNDSSAATEPVRRTPRAESNAALVAFADRQSGLLKSISARLNVTIVDAKGSDLSLNGTYCGNARGDYRLRLTGPFGICALDIVSLDNRVTLIMPTKKLVVQGDQHQGMNAGTSELPLLLAVSSAKNLFLPTAWNEEAVERRAKAQQGELVVSVFGARVRNEEGELFCMRKFRILRELRAVGAQEIMASDGSRIGTVRYLDHTPLLSWPQESVTLGADTDRNIEFPRSIDIAHASGNLKIQIAIQSLTLNTPLAEDCFALETPKNTKPRDLVDIIRSGEKIFTR